MIYTFRLFGLWISIGNEEQYRASFSSASVCGKDVTVFLNQRVRSNENTNHVQESFYLKVPVQ